MLKSSEHPSHSSLDTSFSGHASPTPAFVPPHLYVLAGVDGAGKSSIAGATFRTHGADYFDPDQLARQLAHSDPALSLTEADGLARLQGTRLIERAIAGRLDHAFETTLGARTVPRLVAEAAAAGFSVHVWYAGLTNPELHLLRVKSRAAAVGHAIAEDVIRRRFQHSRLNLIELLPCLAALRLYDNSAESDPASGVAPRPRLLLHVQHGDVVGPDNLSATPDWARPIVVAALRRTR
ncbi:MAG: zeta toxin family protein [Burkholderiaceae bacterium]